MIQGLIYIVVIVVPVHIVALAAVVKQKRATHNTPSASTCMRCGEDNRVPVQQTCNHLWEAVMPKQRVYQGYNPDAPVQQVPFAARCLKCGSDYA